MINSSLVIIITAVSAVSLLLSIFLIPYLLVKMPYDYFVISREEFIHKRIKHPVLRVITHILKNLFGIIFLAAGIVMLFIPGQGILTILIGVSLVDFPFKKKVEMKVISIPKVLKFINKLRVRYGSQPLKLD